MAPNHPHQAVVGPIPPPTQAEARATWFQLVIDFYEARGLPFPVDLVQGLAQYTYRINNILNTANHAVYFSPGYITGRHLNNPKAHQINALLIQSRGTLSSTACASCTSSGNRKAFPDCVRLPGEWHGACGKTVSGANRPPTAR